MSDEVTIKVTKNGPYYVSGPTRLVDPDDNSFELPEGKGASHCAAAGIPRRSRSATELTGRSGSSPTPKRRKPNPPGRGYGTGGSSRGSYQLPSVSPPSATIVSPVM